MILKGNPWIWSETVDILIIIYPNIGDSSAVNLLDLFKPAAVV